MSSWRSYAQSYPQRWITRVIRGINGLLPAIDQPVTTSNRHLSASSGRAGPTRRKTRMRTYHTVKSGRKGVARLDLFWCGQYPTEVLRLKGNENEADVSAKRTAPEEDARLPRAYEDQGWTQGPQAAAREGAEAAHRLSRWRCHPPSGFEAPAISRRCSSAAGVWSGRPSLCCGARLRGSSRQASRSAGRSGARSSAIERGGDSARRTGIARCQNSLRFQSF